MGHDLNDRTVISLLARPRAVDCGIERVSSWWLSERAPVQLVLQDDRIACIIMNKTGSHEKLPLMHVFCVVQFDASPVLYDTV